MLQGGKKEAEAKILDTIVGIASPHVPIVNDKNTTNISLTKKERQIFKYAIVGIFLVFVLIMIVGYIQR